MCQFNQYPLTLTFEVDIALQTKKLRFSEVKSLAQNYTEVKEPEFKSRSGCSKACVLKSTTPSAYGGCSASLSPFPSSLPTLSCTWALQAHRHIAISSFAVLPARAHPKWRPNIAFISYISQRSNIAFWEFIDGPIITTNNKQDFLSNSLCVFHFGTSQKGRWLAGKELDILECTGHWLSV